MPRYDWMTLTTDYGRTDGFVAAVHGVVAMRAPWLRVIDVTHQIPPGDVARGSAVLADTIADLPPAVHVAVVDPGVGTARRPVALRAGESILVGPDNGLLPAAADVLGGVRLAVHLDDPAWFRPQVSRTFHGRDVFAPAAARLAGGEALERAGSVIEPAGLVRLPEPVMTIGDGWVEAEVRTVDRFGNVQLAAPGEALDGLGGRLVVGGLHAVKGGTFADAPPGGMVAYVDSAGRLALAVNGGRAVVVLAVTAGDVVRIANA